MRRVEAVRVAADVAEAVRKYADQHQVDLIVVATHGRTGLLLPPRRPGLWAAKVGELLGEPERLRSMGREARAEASGRFGGSRLGGIRFVRVTRHERRWKAAGVVDDREDLSAADHGLFIQRWVDRRIADQPAPFQGAEGWSGGMYVAWDPWSVKIWPKTLM